MPVLVEPGCDKQLVEQQIVEVPSHRVSLKPAVRTSSIKLESTVEVFDEPEVEALDDEVEFDGWAPTQRRKKSISEPMIRSPDDIKAWTAWAMSEAEVHAKLVMPRLKIVRRPDPLIVQTMKTFARLPLQTAKGVKHVAANPVKTMKHAKRLAANPVKTMKSAKKLTVNQVKKVGRFKGRPKVGAAREGGTAEDGPAEDEEAPISFQKLTLCSSAADVSTVLGVGVRLYFEILQLFAGLSAFGICCMLPSLIASANNLAQGAYAEETVESMGTSWSALLSLGARAMERDLSYSVVAGCLTDSCIELNNMTAALDVLYCMVAYNLIGAFKRHALSAVKLYDELNAVVSDYSLMLYGTPEELANATPDQLKEEVEAALVGLARRRVAGWGGIRDHHAARLETCSARWIRFHRIYHEKRKKTAEAHVLKWTEFLDLHCEEGNMLHGGSNPGIPALHRHALCTLLSPCHDDALHV